ncbi:MAG TPA: hypothetical protein VFI15_07245, partial [Candidatus Limnocylindrales bacterium]|nr:hypothetical protein [Candidatus Limnocylindrales bacterium]
DRGWIVTFDPTAVTGIVVWRTVDGGRSWDETAIPALRSVNWDLEMLSPTVGWLASDPGGEAPKPELRWTHDGGATWSDPIDLAAPARRSTLDNISFFDERNGVATGNETLLATRDGGGTWNITQDNDIGDGIFAGTPPKPSYGPVHLLDGLRGFVVVRWLRADGSEQIRSIRETEDAGRSWTTRYVDEGRRSWAFIDPSRWVGTDGERVWTTADGGSTFSVSSSTGLPVVLDSANLQFVDELNGWAVATGGPPCKSFGCPARFFVLFKTADGGATWAPVGDCGPGTIASCPSPRPS